MRPPDSPVGLSPPSTLPSLFLFPHSPFKMASTFNIEAMYAHGTPPLFMPISMAAAIGPYFILVFLLSVLCGINLALFCIYFHLYFFKTQNRDPFLLRFSVLLSVLCNLALALYGFISYYIGDLFQLYSSPGYDVNKIEVYVVPFHTLSGIPVAIGQMYFAIRIAKLFDARNIFTQFGFAFAVITISVQFVLINWFGAAFYSVGYKTRLLDPQKQHWVKGILDSWTIVFILIELCMLLTTIARLMILRGQTSMDAARKVIWKLAMYSIQGQILLTGYSLSSLYLFSSSETGWYSPLYLLSGALYTMVMLANLILRRVVAEEMKAAREGAELCEMRSGSDVRELRACTTRRDEQVASSQEYWQRDHPESLPPPVSDSSEGSHEGDGKAEAIVDGRRWQLSPLPNDGRSPSPLLPLVLLQRGVQPDTVRR
ncbi:Pentafunctional AROM polypeptide [Pseudozyma hubeiensis]|nr:Pentafunctional AROM polypeptide [Pseudozyma hubeiensis]